MIFITLRVAYNCGYIYVNPNYIASFASNPNGGSKIFVANDSNPIIVEETPEQITDLIKSALCQK